MPAQIGSFPGGGFTGGSSGGAGGGGRSSRPSGSTGGGRAAQLAGLAPAVARSPSRDPDTGQFSSPEIEAFQKVLRAMLLGEAGGSSLL